MTALPSVPSPRPLFPPLRPSSGPSARLACLACVSALALTTSARAQPLPAEDGEALKLRDARLLSKPGTGGDKPALVLSAQRLSSQVDQSAEAEGGTELRYGELVIRSDRLSYQVADDLAQARGDVRVSHGGNLFSGPALSLYVSRFEGEFLTPSFFIGATGGSGRAASIRFIDSSHFKATSGTYSSCPVQDQREPAWRITARSLTLDLQANEGVAEGAVLRFLGVPLLAAPSLSFPLGAQRKSGFLPPDVFLDNRSGFEWGQPYYWNIAPQRDATFTPFVMTRRGPGLDSEFRYLEPEHSGRVNLDLLPYDRLAGRSRWAVKLDNDGLLGRDWRYRLRAEQVSDDDYWKDLSRRVESQTHRLLASDLALSRNREMSWGQLESYVRVQRWQPLQGTDPLARFNSPYQRSPQIGLRLSTAADEAVLDSFRPWGRRARLEGGVELEYNRFDLPSDGMAVPSDPKVTGQRVHLLAHVATPLGGEAWWLIPRLSINAASYSLDQIDSQGRRHPGRVIPTFSLDHGWLFERDTTLFDKAYRQTLEPRVLYVSTPYRAQADLPNFDSAAKDFNFDSIYTDNPFSGVDRVSDLHAVSLGATSRWINARQGEEVLRLGAVQRYLIRDQRITPEGTPQTKRWSDLLLAASASLSQAWRAEAAIQFNPAIQRSVRTVMRARYSPGPYRTVSLAYRLARGQSEQVEAAWQWPIWGQEGKTQAGAAGCAGAWYSAARVQYSLRDRRLTDSVAGLEYDAGCWLLRMGVERLATGRAETKTQFMLQLELVGLSQLGSNALKVLKDNVTGYRRLSADRSPSSDFQP